MTLKVLYTVDTELWPWGWDLTKEGLDTALALDFEGRTTQGLFGVPFQIDLLNEHGLKGVFLVESLFASAVGVEPLRAMCDPIHEGGQEIQLHAHTEWLPYMPNGGFLDGRTGQNMADFPIEDQTRLIEVGLANLANACHVGVTAFRAGNYGADNRTLAALASNGLRYDTSYNYCHLNGACGMVFAEPLLQPRWIDGVLEIPVNYFRDRPGGFRHTQLMACSFAEMRAMLLEAWKAGWRTFVIVSHSFELINREKRSVDATVVKRFERLCRFLADNTDKFETCGFNDLDESVTVAAHPVGSLRSHGFRTLYRMGEQVLRRFG